MALVARLRDPGWNPGAGLPARRLFELDGFEFPWVAIGKDRGSHVEYTQFDGDRAALEAKAVAALRDAHPVSWERREVPLPNATFSLHMATRGEYTAERILDVDLLRDLQQQLGTKLLAVGIPRRGLLMATNGRQDRPLLAGFVGMVEAQHRRAETDPLFASVLAVQDGRIVGALGSGHRPADPPGARLVPARQGQVDLAVDIRGAGMTIAKTGARIMGTVLPQVLGRPDFTGTVRVLVTAPDDAKSDTGIRLLGDLLERVAAKPELARSDGGACRFVISRAQ